MTFAFRSWPCYMQQEVCIFRYLISASDKTFPITVELYIADYSLYMSTSFNLIVDVNIMCCVIFYTIMLMSNDIAL